jgi:hypothetical protein
MTNDEALMTKQAQSPNAEKGGFVISDFVILSSFWLRHSSFFAEPPAAKSPAF